MNRGFMPVTISEIRLTEIDEAIAFAGQYGCTIERQYVRHKLSLLIRHDEDIVGLAVCAGIEGLPHTKLYICSNSELANEEIQNITDKAMMKLHAAQLCKFEIKLYGSIKDKTFWPQNNWLSQLEDTDTDTDTESSEEARTIISESKVA
ncbi:hypothetical protein JD969_12380 [Planctomycetota bacterium]|nr:hypothetical protein JD969_12380 [Planctomycetota bacterium]